MPIRAGSGGLRYPLPSQRDIQARQNAAAASAGGSASASAYGANRRYAGLKLQLGHDAIQSELDRRFRSSESEKDRASRYQIVNRQQQGALARQESDQEFREQQLLQQQQFRQDERLDQNLFEAGERQAREAREALERDKDREFRLKERQEERELRLQEREDERAFRRREGDRDRDSQLDLQDRRGQQQLELERQRQEGQLNLLERQREREEAALRGLGNAAPGTPPVVRTAEDYERLNEGDLYIGSDGKMHRKTRRNQ